MSTCQRHNAATKIKIKHMKTIKINEVDVTVTQSKTEPREGRQPFSYYRLDLAQWADKDNPMNVAEVLSHVAGYDVVTGWLQAGLDRAFQAAQREAGKDTLADDAKLTAALAYMTESKFGLSKSTNLSPAERITKEFESAKKTLVADLKAKTITHAQFAAKIAEASTRMTTDLLALPTS